MSLCHVCLGGPSQHKVKGYNLVVCHRCWQQAAEGWPKEYEPTLFDALARAGLLIPDRNAHGRLPRTYLPPEDFNL